MDPSEPENPWLSAFVSRVQGAIPGLTELDRLAGDGDFGHNMDAAFGDINLPLRGDDATLLTVLSQRLLIRSGGTSGAVLGTLFRELGNAMQQSNNPVVGLATGLRAGLDAITDLGGAKEGDNTLVDALAPAVRAATKVVDANHTGAVTFAELLKACHDAAVQGALATRDMVAAKGRASYLGDASRGVVDPGAVLVSWIFGGSGSVSDLVS